MDLRLALGRYGIDAGSVPKGAVNLLRAEQYAGLSSEAQKFASREENKFVLAYALDTEYSKSSGILLRNLHTDPSKKANLVVTSEKKFPLWHNLTWALPFIWDTQVVLLVEGPKDCRALWGYGFYNTVAYLGSAPSREQLRVISRYASTVIWLPDNDLVKGNAEKFTRMQSQREERVQTWATEWGLVLRKKLLPVKDAGLLGELSSQERYPIVSELREFVRSVECFAKE